MNSEKFSMHISERIARKLDKARELKENEWTTAEILSELNINEATLHKWQINYGAMTKSEVKEL